MKIPARCAILFCCLCLNSCSLLQSAYNLAGGLLGAVGRTLRVENEPSSRPIHLEQQEIENARTLLDTPSKLRKPVSSENVAAK